ncbi:MAG: general transcription factor IIH subunit 3-like [Trebouxia sp. A1-2]|nr:MAG: general transcription factor IIH subunit 3-like [Trebouxia sp. A1-2]
MWDQLQDKVSGKQLQDPQTLGKAEFCQQILLFLNTYLILQEGNKAAVFAVDGSGSHLLHLTPSFGSTQAKPKQHSTHSVAEQVLQQLLKSMAANNDTPDHDSPPCWSAALSRALCLIHKQQGTSASSRTEGSKPRILCINGSPDVPAQYIATMNAIFSAQRHGVVIETCMVGASDSAFLQQAAHITGGLYLRPRRTGALLQYLLVSISDFSLIEYIQPMVLTSGHLAFVIRKRSTWGMYAQCAYPYSARWELPVSCGCTKTVRVFNMWDCF